jgi:alkanesulfonate monooxygenase
MREAPVPRRRRRSGRGVRPRGARGHSTSLVGTPQQVAKALVDYYDLGVTAFLIRGFDPLDDAIEYGRSLLPSTREAIARREAAKVAA